MTRYFWIASEHLLNFMRTGGPASGYVWSLPSILAIYEALRILIAKLPAGRAVARLIDRSLLILFLSPGLFHYAQICPHYRESKLLPS